MFPGAHLDTIGDKPALIMGGSGFTQTFAELDAAANRLSRLLRSAGLQPGDHIAICMENHDRYMEIIWGCHYAGLVYTAASSRLQSAELEYIINDCGARAYITSKYKADQAAEVVSTTPGVELRLMLDGTIDGYESYESAVEAQSAEPLDEERIAGLDMLYSSGTTGHAEGHLARVPQRAARGIQQRGVDASPGSCSASTTRSATSPPRPSTTQLRCASACRCTCSARRSSPWRTSTPRSI